MTREVQLIMGGYGVGKSTAAVSIADACPEQYIHYLWADRPIDKIYEIYPNVRDRNLLEYPIYSPEDITKAVTQIQSATANTSDIHWVVCDTLSQIYRAFQDGFTRSRYGKTLDEFKLDRLTRLQQNPNDPTVRGLIDGFQSFEWRLIRDKFYNDFFFKLLRYIKANLFFIVHTVPQQGGFYTRPDAVVAKDRFKQIGLLPDVHHNVPGYVDTIMLLSIESDGITHSMQTIKESGRRNVLNGPTPFTDYWRDYERLVLCVGNTPVQQQGVS